MAVFVTSMSNIGRNYGLISAGYVDNEAQLVDRESLALNPKQLNMDILRRSPDKVEQIKSRPHS